MAQSEHNNLIFIFTIVITSLMYSYFISSKLPNGIYKLISLLPIFYLFSILPVCLTSAFATGFTAFIFTWLANFKLILFAFGHAPLYPPKSLVRFIVTACLPVKIKPHCSHKLNNISRLNFLIESVLFFVLNGVVFSHKENLNQHVVLTVYCLLLFLLVDLIVLVSNIIMRAVVGVELDPPSVKPYLATSLQDFWGHRWNLMVTNILRHTIYKPVKSLFSGKVWGSLPAVLATFVVSGLMHELLVYYMTRENPTWEMTLFFVLHGICVVVELVVKRELAGKFELPTAVARSLTVGFVLVTSFWLFFPPLIKTGVDVKVLEEFKLLVDYVKSVFV